MCPRPSCGGGESGRVEGVKLNESMAGGGGQKGGFRIKYVVLLAVTPLPFSQSSCSDDDDGCPFSFKCPKR